jgi:hypothetical protein
MNLGASGIVMRLVFALLLVFASYNPSGHSYFHWVSSAPTLTSPVIVLCGLLLVIGWGLYLRATFNSMGVIGVIASVAVLACLVWLGIDQGWLSPTNTTAMTWVVEVLVAVLLTLGMCWSHFTRRMSGQVDIEDGEK